MHLFDKMCNTSSTEHEKYSVHVVPGPCRIGYGFESGAGAIEHFEIGTYATAESWFCGETAAAEGDTGVA